MLLRSIALGALIAFASLGSVARAQAPSEPVTVVPANTTTAHLYVTLDKGSLLRIDRPFRRISVGTRTIADVMSLSKGLIYVLGKKTGSTNLIFRDRSGGVVAVVDVVVSKIDISGLVSRLRSLMPSEHIDVAPLGEGIVLSGHVSSPDHLRQAVALADQLAPGKVANLLTLGGTQQVLLEVKFAEVERSAMKRLDARGGLNYLAGNDSVKAGWGPRFPDANNNLDAASAFGAVVGTFTHGNYNILAGFQALEKKGLVRTLAEPNLVALSGDTASFLAGGEFPIPVAQAAATGNGLPTVTVQYKNYGVGLSFTPTVVTKDLVNLVVLSEVSSIDPTLAVKANGFDIPALKTRRTKTTVELRDGQSFAIAGLLQNDFTNGTQQLPFLGNLPVLGALFRSPSYQHNQTDLVVLITVHLVSPTVAKNLSTPLNDLVLPTEGDHFGISGDVEDKGAERKEHKLNNNQGFVLP